MLKPFDRVAIANELMKHLGVTDKQDAVKNFLNTLAENNRLGLLEGVCLKFGDLMSAWHQEVELTVTSASVCLPTYPPQRHQLIQDM
jgi:F-type H+-transporting ATPase subunit O